MSQPVRLNTIIDFTAGVFLRGKEAAQSMGKFFTPAIADAVEEGFDRGTKKASPALNKTIAKLFGSGMRSSARELEKSYEAAAKTHMQATMKVLNLERQMESTRDKGEFERLARRRDAADFEMRVATRHQKKLVSDAEKAAKDRMELIEGYEKKRDRSGIEKLKDRGDVFADAINTGLSPESLNLEGLTKGITGGLENALKMGAGKAGAGGDAKMAAQMMEMSSAVGAIAAPIAALVAVLVAATNQTTEMNKGLLESASAMDIVGQHGASVKAMGVEYGGLNLQLKLLRKTSIGLATELRMSKEEVTGMIGAMNEAGLRVSDFSGFVKGNGTLHQKYADVTRTAILAQTGLGVSASEVGEFMVKTYRDLGYKLDDVQGAFGMIAGDADKAGMTTKSFFAAINTASSGMALYNFRVSDTVGLFTDLVKILGEDLAKEQLGLQGTFREMGTGDRVKATMTGGAGIKAAVAGDAAKQGKDFADKLASKELKIEGLTGKDGGLDMDKLAKMSDKSFRAIQTQLRSDDKSGALARQLEGVRGAAKGGPGALGHLSKTGELAAQLGRVFGLTGGQTLSETAQSSTGRMMIEEQTGLQGEALDVKIREEQGLLAKFEAGGGAYGEEFFKAIGSGELFDPKDDIKEEAELQFSQMERSAMEQLQETRSMSQTLSNTIANWLENIWLGVEHMGKLLGFLPEIKDSVSAQALEARKASMAAQQTSRKELADIGDAIVEKRGEMDQAGGDIEKRAKIQKEIDALNEKATGLKVGVEEESAFQQALVTGSTTTEAWRERVQGRHGGDLMGQVSEEKAAELGLTKNVLRVKTYEDAEAGLGGDKLIGELISVQEKLGDEDLSIEQLTTLDAQLAAQQAEDIKRALEAEQLRTIEDDGFTDVVSMLKMMNKAEARTMANSLFGAQLVEDAMNGVEGGVSALLDEAEKGGGITESKLAVLSKLGVDLTNLDTEGRTMLLGGGTGNRSDDDERVSDSTGPDEGPVYNDGLKPSGDTADGDPLNDFIYRGDGGSGGTINPINSRDDFIGAMPGGGMEEGLRAMMAGGGGSGGSKTANIFVNGGNEERLIAILKKFFSESGFDNARTF